MKTGSDIELCPRIATQILFGAVLLLLAGNLAPAETAELKLPKFSYVVVVPGLGYANLRLTNRPWSIHIARLDRKRKEFDILTTLGKGHIQGLASLSAQTAALPSALGKPLAAVNGDFFLIKPGPYQGDPEGLQIINGELVSAPSDQCFWAEANGALHLDRVYSQFEVTWPDGGTSPLGLNQTPKADGATLFTPIFGPSTRATNRVELVLEKDGDGPWLPLRVDQTYQARVREIRPDGNAPLAPGSMVLTMTGQTTNRLAALKPGALLTFTTATTQDIGPAHTAIGGGPVLVREGKEQKWPAKKGGSDYLLPRHPRTALGFNHRYFFLVVVDGRQKDLSMGMNFAEWAACMKQIGCTDALNLDGGGSATFWLKGKVMNSPSDKRERSLANAVMIVQKAK